MSAPLDFQSIIYKLQQYWADYGCLIWQPYHTEIGAGTMNPGTFLRVLGPEPWNVAYVEPSIRPDDGRYGENPNRLQQHYQYQVILKPDPGNPQELYLQSLVAIGIDPRQHDIRFVEDNWEQPALGAWGLGWEVWLDGLEITQFTYFQQAGGITLDPVSVELTYGLERIAMALQGARTFRDIRWNAARTYGDVNLQGEHEHSKYYFEYADVERLRQIHAIYMAEAQACLDNGLVLPAQDYILKCSHTFNVLDTRGAVGYTERQALFGKMRALARRLAETYLDQRMHLEYPWLDESGAAAAKTAAPAPAPSLITPSQPETFLLEIGVEELPYFELDSALGQLSQRIPALLDELRLAHGEVRVSGTPRRLVVLVENLAERQADLEQLVKGPPAQRAYDADGAPTQAALGFARGKGVAVEDLQVREIDGGQYVSAVVRQVGRPVLEVLSEVLPGLAASLRFEKSMRWNHTNVAFSRPVRWLLALFGEQVVPFSYAGISSGRLTRGLRFYQPEEISIKKPADYFQALADQGIILDGEQRKAHILAAIKSLAAEVGGQVPDDPGLLGEVTNLVEAPHALRGAFEQDYLRLPREVLVSVMKKHQRYFPVLKAGGGELLPYFIVVRNGDGEGDALVVEGNAAVIRARFADADYFVRADKKLKLAEYVPQLSTLTFQKELGSMLDKTRRVTALVGDLAAHFSLEPGEQQTALRAAELCKADLATHMVVEMTSLQGIMGRDYALESGEAPAVAQAIFEHYQPRFAGDALPASRPGLLVGAADRLDTLAGLFAVGLAPTGTKDPFALRRAALGLVQSLAGWELDFDLRQGLRQTASHLPQRFDADELGECIAFVIERLRNLLLDQGYRYDVVDAVLVAQGHNPAGAYRAAKELTAWISRPDWAVILPAYARCVRITRDIREIYEVLPEAFVDPAEQALYQAVRTARAAERRPGSVDDFLQSFLPVIPAINTFFERVLVMDEQPVLRANRLGLLQMIVSLADGAADFGQLEGF